MHRIFTVYFSADITEIDITDNTYNIRNYWICEGHQSYSWESK